MVRNLRQGTHSGQPFGTPCPNCRRGAGEDGAFIMDLLSDPLPRDNDVRTHSDDNDTLTRAIAPTSFTRLNATYTDYARAAMTGAPPERTLRAAQEATLWASADPDSEQLFTGALEAHDLDPLGASLPRASL